MLCKECQSKIPRTIKFREYHPVDQTIVVYDNLDGTFTTQELDMFNNIEFTITVDSFISAHAQAQARIKAIYNRIGKIQAKSFPNGYMDMDTLRM